MGICGELSMSDKEDARTGLGSWATKVSFSTHTVWPGHPFPVSLLMIVAPPPERGPGRIKAWCLLKRRIVCRCISESAEAVERKGDEWEALFKVPFSAHLQHLCVVSQAGITRLKSS
jgi:hypothetical protein